MTADLQTPQRAVASPDGMAGRSEAEEPKTAFVVAWLLCLVFFFLTYTLRSAPGIMIPELSTAFAVSALGLSSLLGLYYYALAGFSLVAGASLDRYGARLSLPIGVFTAAIGSGLFILGGLGFAGAGRLLQGAGSAFAFTGAVYLAARGFPARWLASVMGITQAAGLMGGFAGQFVVGALVQGPVAWQDFWLYAAVSIGIVALLLLVVTPGNHGAARGSLRTMTAPYRSILSSRQFYLCGVIAGLLFIPTTIGNMIWGVPFLRQGLGAETADAIARSSIVLLGWVIGAPLLGFAADRYGRRKPVLAGGIILMLISGIAVVYLHGYVSTYISGFLFGIGSGAAIIPYATAKESHSDSVKGSVTGAMNFLVFSFSAVLAPVFGLALQQFSGAEPITLQTFHRADLIWGGAILLALILTFFLHETGPTASPAPPVPVRHTAVGSSYAAEAHERHAEPGERDLERIRLELDQKRSLVVIEPRGWFVCFVPGLRTQWWHRFAHARHKHVFAMRPDGPDRWTLFEPWWNRLLTATITSEQARKFLIWGARGDVLRVREAVPGRGSQVRGWMSCAVLASYMLGRGYWVWTPHGLYKLLLREPGVCRVDVSALLKLDDRKLSAASAEVAACSECEPGAPKQPGAPKPFCMNCGRDLAAGWETSDAGLRESVTIASTQ